MKARNKTRLVAIIDIGSNSVRLTVNVVNQMASIPYINEKIMPGLGRGLAKTGMIDKEAARETLNILGRYQAILKTLKVKDIRPIATAAVRSAKNGQDFAKTASNILGTRVKILDGPHEGKLAGMGVAYGIDRPKGLVGDLGGSSLELVKVDKHKISETAESFLVGPLALNGGSAFNERRSREVIRKELKSSTVLSKTHRHLYAVGGAWRLLAKLDMEQKMYPLKVLHGYTLSDRQIRRIIRYAVSSVNDPAARAVIEQISERRASTLPYAALVMDELLSTSRADQVTVSASGLREGVLFQDQELDDDPLKQGIITLFDLDSIQVKFGMALYKFTKNVIAGEGSIFNEQLSDKRIDKAACVLADAGWRFHPDHRVDLVFNQVLYCPLVAVSHPERIYMATAIANRYQRDFTLPEQLAKLLSTEQIQRARVFGALMRLGHEVSRRSSAMLRSIELSKTQHQLFLRVPSSIINTLSPPVSKRLDQAATLLGLSPVIKEVENR